MPHLQPRTTLLLAIFVGFVQLVGAFGFYHYQMAAISSGSFTSPGVLRPEPSNASYSFAWGGVYLCSVLAGLLLSVFAAKGTKLLCAVALVLLIPAVPWALLLLANP